MKKLLLIAVLLCCMLVCGCTADDEKADVNDILKSVGQRAVRLIRLPDGLYYDTGAECDNYPTCGTMSGLLEKKADEYEIPTEDYTVNFDGASGYQTYTEGTINVPLDDKWIIFRKIKADTVISGYKYCMYIKDECKISEHIAFTNDFESDDVVLIPVKYGTVFDWGIELTAENVTPCGLTLVCRQSGGSPKGSLETGSWYDVQKYNGNWWQPVMNLQGEYDVAWTMEAYLIPNNGEVKWDVDWKWMYGELEAGEYRIAKNISDRTGSGSDSYTYYAYFTIEN